MTATVGVRRLLEQLHQAKVRPQKRRMTKAERTPAQPTGAELAYAKALRNIVTSIGKATRRHIVPIIPQVAAPEEARTDAAGDISTAVALDRLRDEIREIVAEAAIAGIIESALDRTSRHNLGEMSRVLGIQPENLDPLLAETMTGWRAENVALIQSIGEEYLAEVERYVTIASTEGIRAEELAKALVDRLGVAQSRAELIAVDQVLKANAQLGMERMLGVGVTRYEWSTARDARVRPGHKSLDGTVHRWDQPPIVDPKTGRREHPGRDYRCRCAALPVLDD